MPSRKPTTAIKALNEKRAGETKDASDLFAGLVADEGASINIVNTTVERIDDGPGPNGEPSEDPPKFNVRIRVNYALTTDDQELVRELKALAKGSR